MTGNTGFMRKVVTAALTPSIAIATAATLFVATPAHANRMTCEYSYFYAVAHCKETFYRDGRRYVESSTWVFGLRVN